MLKGEKGNVVAVQVGEQVKRFNELKVGDKVSATYMESVAVSVRQPGQPAPTSSSGVTTSTGAPGATAAARDTITVTVLSVDKTNQSVSVKRKDGTEVSMRVENPKYLEAVKAGDTVDITYTRALLLEVAPVKGRAPNRARRRGRYSPTRGRQSTAGARPRRACRRRDVQVMSVTSTPVSATDAGEAWSVSMRPAASRHHRRAGARPAAGSSRRRCCARSVGRLTPKVPDVGLLSGPSGNTRGRFSQFSLTSHPRGRPHVLSAQRPAVAPRRGKGGRREGPVNTERTSAS